MILRDSLGGAASDASGRQSNKYRAGGSTKQIIKSTVITWSFAWAFGIRLAAADIAVSMSLTASQPVKSRPLEYAT